MDLSETSPLPPAIIIPALSASWTVPTMVIADVSMKITLINHACIKIETRATSILCDPWLEGPVFNNGWQLLIKTPVSTDELMKGVTHIWLSHEHPDHFSPKFFFDLAKTHAGKVTVLFQRTHDGRVRKFCQSRGFNVKEISEHEKVCLDDNVSARIGKSEFYDSWLFLDDGTTRLLNINDCPLRDPKDISKVAAQTGQPDILLTQFSYAAWKGGRDHKAFREDAARDKLVTVRNQIQVLHPRYVLPFASFSYFSNVENSYLNDSVNTPDEAARAIQEAGADPVVLFPGDEWEVGTKHSNESALDRFREIYIRREQLPLLDREPSVPVDELQKKFEAYRKRIYAKNSAAAIWMLRRLPVLGAFYPIRFYLTDLQQTVSVSIVDGFQVSTSASAEAELHSASLAFVFDNEFGFDTLTVNGRFEATPAGFSKMVKGLAVGSLNAMGLTLSWKILRNTGVITTLLHRLAQVMTRLPGKPIGDLE